MPRGGVQGAALLALATLLLAALPTAEAALGKRVVCYIPDWAVWRPGACSWTPSKLNPAHCTHVMYSFAFLDATFSPLIVDETSRNTLVPQAAALKQKKPGLKVMLSIGGWSMNELTSPYRTRWSDAVATPQARQLMITNTMNWLDKNGFDGLDIDWEYPGVTERSGRATDRAGLAALLAEWKVEAARRGKPYLLSMAAPPYIPNLIGINMAVAKQHLDFINLMTYDFHGTWETEVNFMAPWSDPAGGTLDISNTLNHFINVLGWPRSKLNLGLGLYGASWTLSPGAPAAIGAAAAGTGPGQPCTRQAGYASWGEVRALINAGAQVFVSTAAKHAYVVYGRTFITCDTPTTLQMKIDAATALGLGGLMVWEYSLDDAQNTMMKLVPARHRLAPPRHPHRAQVAVPAGQLTVVDRPALVNAAGLFCGGSSLGNGVCQDRGACCSRWGHCGRAYGYCSLDKGYCVGGACADLSRSPQALLPPINNGSSAVRWWDFKPTLRQLKLMALAACLLLAASNVRRGNLEAAFVNVCVALICLLPPWSD
ncbi:chitotriosidase-1- isoform B [Chlorella sorokiniana]|uniref:Chitotriosidase-1-isoform B n=1 Tax=Chlorella sorokiniana TaxID=3076 RepID=A0A2P6TEY4_CHLSO|nr:chitotriosidase-1- isoform B [Chlorella sorokiniana]|eukprot:PRW32530.1 chitotriosidase-1- isoform B [Chlorella sorokiniana]